MDKEVIKKETAEEQAKRIYEVLEIDTKCFLSQEEIGALHQKQMQAVYNDFSNSSLVLK